jgi:predicted ester cyclase
MSTFYEIRVHTHLSSQWAKWFEGLAITNHPNGEASLSGPFPDQAALYGVLDKVRDMNLALIAVKRTEPGRTSIEKNKAIICGYLEEVLSQGNLEATKKYISEQVVINGAPPGREAILAQFRLFRNAFPDIHVRIEGQIAEGDQVATRVNFQGTHLGKLWNIPPTGRQVMFNGIALDRIAGCKVIEMWHEADFLGLRKQLQNEPYWNDC